MLKWIHVLQTAIEIGIETEKGKGIGIGIRKGTGLEKGKGTESGKEIETETETGIAIVIVIETVRRGEMVVELVLLEVRVVEGPHEARPAMLTTQIGRWRREWDCKRLASVFFDHDHFFVSMHSPKTMQYQQLLYLVRIPLLYNFIRVRMAS
jgi:hypothetical protein